MREYLLIRHPPRGWRQGIADADWPRIEQIVLEVETLDLARRIVNLLECAMRRARHRGEGASVISCAVCAVQSQRVPHRVAARGCDSARTVVQRRGVMYCRTPGYGREYQNTREQCVRS